MLAYAHGADTTPLLGLTIGEALRLTVEKYPDREALVVPHQGYRVTYRELWEEVTAVAKGLLALGLEKGDRVGIWAPNRFEWVLVQLATARIGAVLVNINPAYKATELAFALKQADVRVLLLAREFRGTDFVEVFRSTMGETPVRVPLVIDGEWSRLSFNGRRVSDARLAAYERTLGFDDPINIQYTSGTTGFPKGATLTHHNILNNGYFVGRRLRYSEEDRICIPVPFYHCFGMVMGNLAAITHGATMVIPGESFDAAAVLSVVESERCTSLYGVPTMFHAILESPHFAAHDLSRLRTGIMAGAPCPEELLRKVRTELHMPDVTVCYGMTETSPVSTQTMPDDSLGKRVKTVGKVQSHLEVKIVRENGETCARGEVGELCTRGYSVMLGYWSDATATAAVVDEAGWMHTGDLASMDAEGYVAIEGRKKDMIIRGGENVYPRELEEFLITHPAIAEAHVVGVPSEKYGEEVMAWIRLRPGDRPTDEELTEFCKSRIAGFKVPRHWRVVDAFPLTITGKVQKYRLRELAKDGLTPRPS